MPVAQQTQVTFKDIQSEYDHLFTVDPIRDEDRGYVWHAKTILKRTGNDARILDVACGGGFFLRELHRLSGGKTRLSGSDISGEALKLSRKECPAAELLMAVAEALPYDDNSFDAVTCLGSLEHFLDVRLAVNEMKRVVRSGGFFYILVPNLFWYKDITSVLFTGDRLTRNQTHERFASLGEWKSTLEELGLQVSEVLKYNGIARHPAKQFLKDMLIPTRFSYHLLYICTQKK